ncbi:MAG: tail fiber assembly protein, partial [Burkholderiaceae bacterium]
LDASQAASQRAFRNTLLSDCDWTQLPDAPVNTQAWAYYRQALRDVTSQTGFPWDIQWPEKPQ